MIYKQLLENTTCFSLCCFPALYLFSLSWIASCEKLLTYTGQQTNISFVIEIAYSANCACFQNFNRYVMSTRKGNFNTISSISIFSCCRGGQVSVCINMNCLKLIMQHMIYCCGKLKNKCFAWPYSILKRFIGFNAHTVYTFMKYF